MYVTIELLRRKRACLEHEELFLRTFGDRVEVTLENCLKAAEAGLSLSWASRHLLTQHQRNQAERLRTYYFGLYWDVYYRISQIRDKGKQSRKFVELYDANKKAQAYIFYAGVIAPRYPKKAT